MIPIRDINPVRTRPVVTWVLIALCAAVFMYELTLSEAGQQAFFQHWALVPARISAGDPHGYVTVLTSMFLHGGLMHVIGNLWFLRLFGDNVEDAVGRPKYLALYLVSGIAAAAAQYFAAPDSTAPMLGASGAIGGVLGAYAVLFPRARVMALMPGTLGWVVQVPSIVYLGLWLVLQFVGGFGGAGGVAYWAHVGGFATGALLGLLFRPHASGAPQDPESGAQSGRGLGSPFARWSRTS